MAGPTVSVCIACLNEGPDLEATIANVYASKYRPHEVIVCDDNSEHDPVDRLASWIGRGDFKYLRNPVSFGSGGTKARAIDAASGDLIVILDSHMRPYYAWLNQIVQAHVSYPNALLCTESIGFDQPHQAQFYGRGAWFGNSIIKHGAHTVEWQPSAKLETGTPYPRIQAMHGGCYIFPRYQLRRLHGYAPLLKGWGYEEEWLAMRAAALGIETRLVSGCPVPHQYERNLHRRTANPTDKPSGWGPWYNRHVVTRAVFGHDRWASTYAQAIRDATPEALRQHADDELTNDAEHVDAFGRCFRQQAMPESDWMPRLGIRHPGPPEPDTARARTMAPKGPGTPADAPEGHSGAPSGSILDTIGTNGGSVG